MNQFRRPWFIAGVLCAVALFSTVVALGLQAFFGRHLVFVLVGPACSVAGGLLLVWWLKKTESGNEELQKGPE
jgi:Na+/melibiose symporter-like transporter